MAKATFKHSDTFYETMIKCHRTDHVNNYLHPRASSPAWIKAKELHYEAVAKRKPDAYYEDIEDRRHRWAVGDVHLRDDGWWVIERVDHNGYSSMLIPKPFCVSIRYKEVVNFSNHGYDKIFINPNQGRPQ